MTAARRAGGARLRAVHPLASSLDHRRYTYSDGITDGRRFWSSGQTASQYDPESGRVVVRGEAREQSTAAYAKLEATLASEGAGLGAVLQVVEYQPVTGLRHADRLRTRRTELLADNGSRVTVRVVEALLRPEAVLEAEVEALIGGPESGRDAPAELLAEFGYLRLPTVHPIDLDGTVQHPGDARSQLAWCLDRVAREAALAGQTPVTVSVTVVDGGLEDARPSVAAGNALLTTCSVSTLGQPAGVVLSVDAVVTATQPLPVDSRAVRVGDLLLIHGLRDEDATDHSVADQATAVYQQLTDLLVRAGVGPSALVRTVECVRTDAVPGYRAVGGVRRELLRSPWPASTGLVYTGLDGMDTVFTVDAVALLPYGRAVPA